MLRGTGRCWKSLVPLIAMVSADPAVAAPDLTKASLVLSEAIDICTRDAGRLWGADLCGPVMLVDPADHQVVANERDADGALRAVGKLFIGRLPDNAVVANTVVHWSGTRWTQLVWPTPDEAPARRVLLGHELFHRVQAGMGLVRSEKPNSHLDELEGRYLLQLEWRALARALNAASAAIRAQAVSDALAFRGERYRLYPQAASAEAALEINEGVAEYTGVRLGLGARADRIAYATSGLARFVRVPTFVRSFAYATGPAYGLLLDDADPTWRSKLPGSGRLDQLLGAASPRGQYRRLAHRIASYDKGQLRALEVARDTRRRRETADLRRRFIEGPVLIAPIGPAAAYQFNPQTLRPLGEAGTIYPTLRLKDEWGSLTVEQGGALLRAGEGTVRVIATGAGTAHGAGDGWTITLKPGWVILPAQRPGDFAVTKR